MELLAAEKVRETLGLQQNPSSKDPTEVGASLHDSAPSGHCKVCGEYIRTMVFKGTDACGEMHHKELARRKNKD